MRDSTRLASLTRMFSSTVFNELAKKSRSALLSRLIEQSNVSAHGVGCQTLADAFESAFEILKIAGNRDEYVYRSAITQKVLLGNHSLHTATALNEVRAGACKADVVILNGTSTVYEIKSERDSLTRLSNQIINYKRVFAAVNIITSESHLDHVMSVVPDDVGVMVLTNRFQISTRRKATNRPEQICPETVLDSLRSSEAISILESFDIRVPDVPNTQHRAMLRVLFAKLDPSELHSEMVRILKESRTQAPMSEFVKMVPSSLRTIALSSQTNEAGRQRFLQALNTPLSEALSWK